MQKIYTCYWIKFCNTTYQKIYIFKIVSEKQECKAVLTPVNETCRASHLTVFLLRMPESPAVPPPFRTQQTAAETKGLCSWSVVSWCQSRRLYWYQGVFRTQRRVNPASVRILMEAASASLTVSFTDCIRFWALWTSISVAWSKGCEESF